LRSVININLRLILDFVVSWKCGRPSICFNRFGFGLSSGHVPTPMEKGNGDGNKCVDVLCISSVLFVCLTPVTLAIEIRCCSGLFLKTISSYGFRGVSNE